MKISSIAIATALVAGIFMASVAVAESTPGQILAQCKKDAQSDGIAPEDMPGYIRSCLDDNGIEAADADKMLKDMFPEGEAPKSGDDLS